VSAVHNLAEQVWADWVERDPLIAIEPDRHSHRLSTGSLAEAESKATAGRTFLENLAVIDPQQLTGQGRLTHGYLEWVTARWARAETDFWYEIPIAPYTSRDRLRGNLLRLQDFRFEHPGDVEEYIALVHGYAATINEIVTVLSLQASRGIVLSRQAIPGAEAHIRGYRAMAEETLMLRSRRTRELGEPTASKLREAARRLWQAEVQPAFDRVLDYMTTTYAEGAHDEVGFGRYPGGEEYYRAALSTSTTSIMSAEELHRLGLAEVARLTEEMASLRGRLGLADEADFKRALAENSAMYASTPDQVRARYARHLEGIGPQLSSMFSRLQEAPYELLQLEAGLEKTTTYGFYTYPTPSRPFGAYHFNGSELGSRSLLSAATLALHEIVPGHHLQLSWQLESSELPDVRRQPVAFVNAFIEGWAEYAAGLGWELGAYEDPYDAYGRRVFERFFAQRMVVDTGLNLLGWTLDEGREYMRANTMESEVQIRSETIRYSTDFPSQCVAYRYGHLEFASMRDDAAAALGPAFDIRTFHDVILDGGGLPLPLVRQSVEHWVAETKASAHHDVER
jgi:uncharacterized protein (DUF885 family)